MSSIICFILVVPYQYSTSNRNTAGSIMTASLVVPYQYSTSNRNLSLLNISVMKLFLINILHQTATYEDYLKAKQGCSLSIFYIKPQLFALFAMKQTRCSLSIFYIKPQPIFVV